MAGLGSPAETREHDQSFAYNVSNESEPKRRRREQAKIFNF